MPGLRTERAPPPRPGPQPAARSVSPRSPDFHPFALVTSLLFVLTVKKVLLVHYRLFSELQSNKGATGRSLESYSIAAVVLDRPPAALADLVD